MILNNGLKINNLKSKFYQNASKTWKKLDLTYKPKNFDSIKNDLIYLNPIIKDDRGQLFKNPGYYQNRNMPN